MLDQSTKTAFFAADRSESQTVGSTELSTTLALDDTEKHLYIQHLPNKFRDEYVVQKNADECYLCGMRFSKLSFSDQKKRSHCRRCGESVCRLCSQSELPICQENVHKAERVCDKCACDIQNLHIKAHYREGISTFR